MARCALITGVTGQHGSYLAELLLARGYEVTGVTSGKGSLTNLSAIKDSIQLIVGDISNASFVRSMVEGVVPDEIYNLAAANIPESWDCMSEMVALDALAPVHFLEAIRRAGSGTRLFQASSAEIFGAAQVSPQDERAAIAPRNPYGFSKSFAHSMVGAYRARHGLFAVSGILYPHESPRRDAHFVMRKVTSSLAKVQAGTLGSFDIGNLDARRDWGFAGDYANAMIRTLQTEVADDYVIATGITHSVRELIQHVAEALEYTISFRGAGMDEVVLDAKGKEIIRVNPAYYRPLEPVELCGDISKLSSATGWSPQTSFQELVSLMVKYDRNAARER